MFQTSPVRICKSRMSSERTVSLCYRSYSVTGSAQSGTEPGRRCRPVMRRSSSWKAYSPVSVRRSSRGRSLWWPRHRRRCSEPVRVAEDARALTRQLTGRLRSPSEIPEVDELPGGVRMFSAATSTGSPIAPQLHVTRTEDTAVGRCRLGIARQGPHGSGHSKHGRPGTRSGPYTGQAMADRAVNRHLRRSAPVHLLYHQQTKNLLVSYSPKELGFFQATGRGT